ncbi:MAG: KGK domain-containing protein [Planktothrix sp. GU0601_MAG3]|nr:MAG: KGK domain-containing protein [Planktothrix sp. GU0601_MAG3]
MTDNFYPLTCDDDLLLIDKDTFTVARFKEFAMDDLSRYYNRSDNNRSQTFTFFNFLNKYYYEIDGKIELQLTQSSWTNFSASVECKLLSLSSGKGWISGKLIIKSTVNLFPEDYKNFTYNSESSPYPKSEIEIELQFCPEKTEPLETSDSALDELRQQLKNL